MRLYTFCNYYLSSIQQGIQSAHVVHELFNKYRRKQEETALFEWSRNHKTMVVLNGGNCETLDELMKFMGSDNNDFPWQYFYEDGQSLNGALTCVGIVIPERIYEASSVTRKRGSKWKRGRDDTHFTLEVPDENNTTMAYRAAHYGPFTPWEKELIERLGTFSLAK